MTNQNFFYRSFNSFLQFMLCGVIVIFLLASVFVISGGVDKANAAIEPVANQEYVFDTPMPKISGVIDGVDEVLVYIDNVLNGKAKVVNGKFSYYPFLPLSSGNHEISVQPQPAGFPKFIKIIPNPSPVFLSPEQGSVLGQDRVWVGGVAKNNSLIRVFVDGKEWTRVNTKNHVSGTGSFSAELKDLPLGIHVVSSIARDFRGKDSFSSDVLIIKIMPSTPAPILNKPIVNAYSGIERPFITGFAKNNLEIIFVIDDKIVKKMPLGSDDSGTISFFWQPSNAFSLGNHKIEVFASDNGKLSNNSKAVYWQVGEIFEENQNTNEPELKVEVNPEDTVDSQDPISVLEKDQSEVIVVQDPEDSSIITVQDEKIKENPIVPDEVESIVSENDIEGRIAADDDFVLGAQDNIYDTQDQLENLDTTGNKIKEITPGSVVREVDAEDSEFTFNTSLIIGIVILVFLLLSILVWYIQEKKEEIGDRVVNIFREDEEEGSGVSGDSDFEYTDPENNFNKPNYSTKEAHTDSIRPPQEKNYDKKKNDDLDIPLPPSFEPPSYEPPSRREGPEDLPPPPPPMF